MKIRYLITVILLGLSQLCHATAIGQHKDFPIIPKPLKTLFQSGNFNIQRDLNVTMDTKDLSLSHVFTALKLSSKKFQNLKLAEKGKKRIKNTIIFKLDQTLTNDEAYVLDVNKRTIVINYKKPVGAFYAVNTLKQLVNESANEIPCVRIEDSPRFGYRGFMLDVVRHFQPIATIKKYIDILSFYKINTLHLHLTDDQGWRIEIKKYPKLQEVAAFRDETLTNHLQDNSQHIYDGKRHGGYYTQEQLKELVKYAESKFITVIPEIELPGHATAAIAAYPELGCDPSKKVKVATRWGIFYDIFCPTETTFKFFEDVFSEVIEIFPSKYIHIGGDEVPKRQWEASSIAQNVIKENKLKNEAELQSYFIHRIEKFLNSKGKAIIGWEEILEGGLAPNATVMSWLGEQGGIAAAKLKHDVIMVPYKQLYLDQYQTEAGRKTEPLAIGGYLPLEKIYAYNPVPEVLSEDEKRYILGLQANVWTEYIPTNDHLDHMAFPRACAVAEIAWTALENKDFKDFSNRLKQHIPYLDAHQIKYADYFFKSPKP